MSFPHQEIGVWSLGSITKNYNLITNFCNANLSSFGSEGVFKVGAVILSLSSVLCVPLISETAQFLYKFKHPSQYDEGLVLKSVRKLNHRLIIEEWDNIQRILTSLALKTTTEYYCWETQRVCP